MNTVDHRLTASDDDREVFAKALAWLRGLDLTTGGPDTRAALEGVAETLHRLEHLEAIGAAPTALKFIFKVLACQLIEAQVTHERETGTLIPEGEPVSADEFRRRHITPMQAEARRVVRVMRRQARANRSRCHARPHARRLRRTAARRAAGIRSGNDPGDDGPAEPAPALALAPPPKAILSYGCSGCPERGRLLLWHGVTLACANRFCSRWGKSA